MAVSQHLPFIADEVFNRPQLITEGRAAMIVAVLSGRMNISQLVSDFDTLDARGMEDLAAMGRVEARAGRDKPSMHPSSAGKGGELPYQMTDSGIAIIPVKGTLKRSWGIGPYSGATGYDGIWTQMMHAEDNPQVRAMWFDHNSGGGTTDGVFDLADGIYNNSARFGGKPKWAMAADFSASASYLLSSACDKVFTPKTGMVGSIGCVICHMEASRALDEEGITATVIRSKNGKMRGNAVEALDDDTRARFQEMVDEVDSEFVERVARFRGISKKSVHETNAEVYTGTRALATGLISGVMSEPEAWMKLERMIARK